MGMLFKKSNSEKYKRYFTHNADLQKEYRVYNLKERQFRKVSEQYVEKAWEPDYGGVPIASDKPATPSFQRVYIDHTDVHTLVIGPTGSKKSRLIAMPVVRILGSNNSKESMIISDPKSEIYKRTAAFLEEQGYRIRIINFRSPEYGDRWNPLYIPYKFYCEGNIDRAYEFVNDISENLIRDSRLDKQDPFWDLSAGSLFFGLVLLLFKYCKEFSLSSKYINIGNVVRLRNLLFLKNGRNSILWNYAKNDSIIESSLIGTVETANDTRAGILSVFDQKMRMFSIQPNLLSMLSDNTADIDEFLQVPTAYYLTLPDEKTGYHGLAALFIKQSYEYLIYFAQQANNHYFDDGKLKRRVNYILDEFSSLPAISDFPEMITAARSRNIRFTLIIQSKNQLVQRYREEAETILTNCNNWIFLTSKELTTLREISELCGNAYSEHSQTPLVSITNLQRLNKDEGEVLVLIGRKKPLVTYLPDICYYDNDDWKVRIPPFIPLEPIEFLNVKLEELHSHVSSTSDAIPSFNIESLIRNIDAKIAELEKEENPIINKENDVASQPSGNIPVDAEKCMLISEGDENSVE